MLLDQMPLWQRLVLVLIVVLLLIAYAVEGQTVVDDDDMPLSKYEKEFLALDKDAVTQAYRNQIVHLFEVWMKDDSGQPARAVKGATQARRAFERSMGGIERRQQQLDKSK